MPGRRRTPATRNELNVIDYRETYRTLERALRSIGETAGEEDTLKASLAAIVNGPGPDIVFFDLHLLVHPVKGDPFHVGPLVHRSGLRTHTIRRYDIDLSSPEARDLTRHQNHMFRRQVGSLNAYLRGEHGGILRIRGRAPDQLIFELGLRPGAPALVAYRSGDLLVDAAAF